MQVMIHTHTHKGTKQNNIKYKRLKEIFSTSARFHIEDNIPFQQNTVHVQKPKKKQN